MHTHYILLPTPLPAVLHTITHIITYHRVEMALVEYLVLMDLKEDE